VAPTILVVDDNPQTRSLIARTLRPQGYEVTAAPNGKAALCAAAVQFPDLVIADVLMPEMDGLTVIDTLRQQDPHLPVIAMSAVPDVLEQRETVPAGLDPESISFLAIPFGLPALMDLVHHLLPLPIKG
jgi:two-component system response regulator MprA